MSRMRRLSSTLWSLTTASLAFVQKRETSSSRCLTTDADVCEQHTGSKCVTVHGAERELYPLYCESSALQPLHHYTSHASAKCKLTTPTAPSWYILPFAVAHFDVTHTHTIAAVLHCAGGDSACSSNAAVTTTTRLRFDAARRPFDCLSKVIKVTVT